MDMTRLLVRMAYWVRRPPARWQIIVAVIVIGLAAFLYTIEHTVGWPAWLTVNKPIRVPKL